MRRFGFEPAALVASIALGVFATGCHKATFVTSPQVARGVEHDEWTDFFIFGLVGKQSFDVHQFCRGEVASVRTGGNAGTGIVTLLTLGIYAPRKVYVTCAADPNAPVASDAPSRSLVLETDWRGRPTAALASAGDRSARGHAIEVGDDVYRISFEGGAR